MLPVLIANVVMLFHRKREDRQIHLFLVLTVVATPPIMFVLGKFPVYYFWMSFIPMCFLAVLTIDRALPFVERTFSKYFGLVTISLVCATIMIGLPARTVIALVESDKRDYAKVSTYIASALNSDDIAFVDFSAYYPAKLHAKKVYLPEYLNIMSAAERRSVSVAIIRDPATDPEKFAATEFGGNWKKSAADYTEGTDRDWLGLVKLAAPYHFAVLRRTTAPVHHPLSRESQ
jgi:hypothetical protein